MLVQRLGAAAFLHESIADPLPGTRFRRMADALATAWTGFAGHVCICAAGIVVRAVAPLLQDKRHDPAVVVVDQTGRRVMSLLSGHEGGANRLARLTAGVLRGEAVITTASESPARPLALGVGCRKDVPADVVESFLLQQLQMHGLQLAEVDGLASVELKRHESGLRLAAARLGLPMTFYPAELLATVPVPHPSTRVLAAVGCPGVAEAAALLLANASSLLIPKQKGPGLTLAVAATCPPPRSSAS